MKTKHTYHIYIYSYCCGGLHSLETDLEYTGSKTGAIQRAREEKKYLHDSGKCRLTLYYRIYDFNTEQYIK